MLCQGELAEAKDRVEELEKHLAEEKRKCKNLQKLKDEAVKVAEQDTHRTRQLADDINIMDLRISNEDFFTQIAPPATSLELRLVHEVCACACVCVCVCHS